MLVFCNRLLHEGNPDNPNATEAISLLPAGHHVDCDFVLMNDGTRDGAVLAVAHCVDHRGTMCNIEVITDGSTLVREAACQFNMEHWLWTHTPQEMGIPLARDFLTEAQNQGEMMLVEVKAPTAAKAEQVAVATLEALSQTGIVALVQSFSVEALIAAKASGLVEPLGLLWTSRPGFSLHMPISSTAMEHCNWDEDDLGDDPETCKRWTKTGIDLAAKLGLQFVNIHFSALDREILDYAHSQGLQVGIWTIRKIEQFEKLPVQPDFVVTEITLPVE